MRTNFCSYTFLKDEMVNALFKVEDALEDPEVFQKIFIVAFSAIQSVNYRCGTNYFPKVIPFLDVAAALDFYAFIRIPYRLLFSYSYDRIDEMSVLIGLEEVITSGLASGNNSKGVVNEFLKKQLTLYLEKMSAEDIAFSSEEQMKKSLQGWMREGLRKDPIEGVAEADIDLIGLKIDLKPADWLVIISEYSLMGADLFCVPDFLQIWGVVKLERCNAMIGRIPLLSKLTKVSLGEFVYGFLAVGFLFQFIKAAKDLLEEDLSPEEAFEAKCVLIASAAEILYSCSNLLGSSPKIINDLALLAKGLGLVVFYNTSKPVFFRTASESSSR